MDLFSPLHSWWRFPLNKCGTDNFIESLEAFKSISFWEFEELVSELKGTYFN